MNASASKAGDPEIRSRRMIWETAYANGLRWDTPIVPGTLPALFAEAVDDFAGRIALDFRDTRLNYAELGRHVDMAAAAFLRAGVRADDAIAVYLPNCPYHPFVFFAGTKIGARLVHLSPLDAERELAFKLADSGARILVTTNIGTFAQMADKLLASGLLDRIIVCEAQSGR